MYLIAKQVAKPLEFHAEVLEILIYCLQIPRICLHHHSHLESNATILVRPETSYPPISFSFTIEVQPYQSTIHLFPLPAS